MQLTYTRRNRLVFIAVVGCLLAVNSLTFFAAYPETMVTDSGCCGNRPLARDFSAFYTAAWRLIHDPSQIYTPGMVSDGEYQVLPQPEAFKYTPSFLLIVLPFLAVGYQQALTAFDVFQFLLLPLIAALLYALLREKGLIVAALVAVIVLVLPSPWSQWGLSVPYYWQWAEGQSKVLETFLLLLSFFAGMKGRPILSGVVFALSVFDPRFALIALPLFLMYNWGRIRRASLAATGAFVVSNLILIYPGTGAGFLRMLLSSGLSTPLYYYTFIPLSAVLVLTLVNLQEMVEVFRPGSKTKS